MKYLVTNAALSCSAYIFTPTWYTKKKEKKGKEKEKKKNWYDLNVFIAPKTCNLQTEKKLTMIEANCFGPSFGKLSNKFLDNVNESDSLQANKNPC